MPGRSPTTIEQPDPRWRELGERQRLRLRVVVEVEADLVPVEGDRPVDVADRDDHHFEGPVHHRAASSSSRRWYPSYMPVSMLLATMPSRDSTAREHRVAADPRAAAAEVLERHRLDADDVGEALELERLDGELVGAHGVEHAVEGVLLAGRVGVEVAVAAAGAEVVALDLHLVAARSEPLLDQVGFGVSPEHRLDGGVELALEVDERHALWGGDGERVGGHRCCSLVGC